MKDDGAAGDDVNVLALSAASEQGLDEVFQAVIGGDVDPGVPQCIAAAFQESIEALSKAPSTLEQWEQYLKAALDDGGHPQPDAPLPKLLDALKSRGILAKLGWEEPPPVEEPDEEDEEEGRQLLVGQPVLALLEEDGEWHDAVITIARPDDTFEVCFTQWGKPQDVTRDNIAFESEVLKEDDVQGVCPICQRKMPLTAHHLRPKEMHEIYRKQKGFTQEVLNICADICRPCHSAVHRTEDNATLAESYYTLELIMEHPKMQSWARYAKNQRPIRKEEWDLKLKRRR